MVIKILKNIQITQQAYSFEDEFTYNLLQTLVWNHFPERYLKKRRNETKGEIIMKRFLYNSNTVRNLKEYLSLLENSILLITFY